MRILRVLDIGLIEYEKAHNLQLLLVEERISGKIPDTLLILEHPHVITLGRRMKEVKLEVEGVPVYHVERGGEATYHGPGQLVGYFIVDLNLVNKSIRDFVWSIEEALIRTLKEFNIEAGRMEGYPGVWVGNMKIASIGLALKWWVTYHGFALNVNTNLEYFKLINPCGLDPSVMTSMEKILGRKIDMESVKKILVEKILEVFSYTQIDFNRVLDSELREAIRL
ncbi:MAG: lipoyl(octanoyl) transferase LipB [Thaumarchaeota archaeon]|nr:lipoyl(octanoyl) transferase LipB [Candidatus Geocrenenecus arthurdayi]MCL7389539.1 lipoyl(octanoyl) transferase LipB [Candidatus Geocrenenecus arthurdayi]MCL7391755.1 lipoyl(octanoyl) transferase LipB [Candidatus Geocrenenecus arthurdayi]MCL7397140.1 lipoyl(octanoyl) transferase LipB [Candidatus Geocrenenecus arthurdayi]MCL7401439.1 lipoyl(octanoyl) transferase LipB [Candidatus Geocrenenecus arthurdayi]